MTQERQSKLREKVTRTIYQKRVQRDQFLREVYASPSPSPSNVDIDGDGSRQVAPTPTSASLPSSSSSSPPTTLPLLSPDRSNAPHIVAYVDNGNKTNTIAINKNTSKANNSSSRPHSAGTTTRARTVCFIGAGTSTKASAGGEGATGGGIRTSGGTAVPPALTQALAPRSTATMTSTSTSDTAALSPTKSPSPKHQTEKEREEEEAVITHRLHHLVGLMQRDVDDEWRAKYQTAVREHEQRLGEG